jgi:hypothetical protein
MTGRNGRRYTVLTATQAVSHQDAIANIDVFPDNAPFVLDNASIDV